LISITHKVNSLTQTVEFFNVCLALRGFSPSVRGFTYALLQIYVKLFNKT